MIFFSMIPLVVFSPLLCSITLIHILTLTFPSLIFISFLSLSLFALVIELQTNIMWWCRYFIRNLMCTPAAVIRNMKKKICMYGVLPFKWGCIFFRVFVLEGLGVEYFNVSFFCSLCLFYFFFFLFLLLLLFTLLWIYCEYIFNTISFAGSDINLATKIVVSHFCTTARSPFF